MCTCFGNMCTSFGNRCTCFGKTFTCVVKCVLLLVIGVLVFTEFCTVCIVFLYCFVYVKLFLLCCLYQCKDCCHRVTTQLQ